MSPKVSVVVICYNQEQFLVDALESVLSQTYSNIEVVIVDDESTDGTADLAKKYEGAHANVFYHRIANAGPSNARNYGISNATGEFILPLDGDDKISEAYIALAVDYFLDNPETRLVYAQAEKFGAVNGPWELKDYSFRGLLLDNMIYCSALFRKSDFLETDGYDVSMREGYEDWEFWITFLSEDSLVHRLDEVGFFYRIKERSRNVDFKRNQQSVQRIYNHIYVKHIVAYSQQFPSAIGAFRQLEQSNPFMEVMTKNLLTRAIYKMTKKLNQWI